MLLLLCAYLLNLYANCMQMAHLSPNYDKSKGSNDYRHPED